MKNIPIYMFLVLAGGLIFYGYKGSLNPCDRVIEYSIGTFDTQFGINRNDFLNYIDEATAVWEKELGKDIFRYKEGSGLKVNLIYDERQVLTEQKRKEEFGLTQAENILKSFDSKLSMLDSEYKRLTTLHEEEIASLSRVQNDYNRKVDEWNRKGGAPEGVYEQLDKERILINTKIDSINKNAISLNKMTEDLNLLIRLRNEAAENYNRIAKSYNTKYGHGLEFNQGEYSTTGEINIYQFDSPISLKMVLSHEFGHALGLDHTEDTDSIMSAYTNPERNSLIVTDADRIELLRVCSY